MEKKEIPPTSNIVYLKYYVVCGVWGKKTKTKVMTDYILESQVGRSGFKSSTVLPHLAMKI